MDTIITIMPIILYMHYNRVCVVHLVLEVSCLVSLHGVWTMKQWIIKIKRKSERFYLHNGIEMCHDGTHSICSSWVSFIKNQRRLQSCDADVQTDVHVRGMRGNILEGTLPAVLAVAREEVPQSFIVWTWKEIIRHTQIYNPAKSCMAHLSHVAERRKKRRGGAEFSEVQFAIGRYFYLLYLQRKGWVWEVGALFFFVIVVESWEAEIGNDYTNIYLEIRHVKNCCSWSIILKPQQHQPILHQHVL